MKKVFLLLFLAIALTGCSINTTNFPVEQNNPIPEQELLGDPMLGATVLFAPQGGTGISSYTRGDLIFATTTKQLNKLSVGTNGYVLTSDGDIPVWAENIPTALEDYVPYTGATGDLNLGSHGIGGGSAAFSSLSLDNFYVDGNTLQTVLANLVLDSSGYETDIISNKLTFGATAGADNFYFDNQYLTIKNSATDNGFYVQNDNAVGDPFVGFKLGSSALGFIGVKDSDSDALYISGGGTFSSKNIRLTSTDTQFFKATSMNKASFAVAQGVLATGATPTVAGSNAWTTANSGATNITDFTNGVQGQTIKIIGNDGGNTTVTDTASIFLEGSVNFTLGDRDVLVLYYDGTRWQEESRSNN